MRTVFEAEHDIAERSPRLVHRHGRLPVVVLPDDLSACHELKNYT